MNKAIILLAVALSGCASLRPDYLTAAIVHTSQPGHGDMPAPLGDGGRSAETNLDGIEAAMRWEHGRAFAETSFTYVAHGNNIAGGPWLATVKAGVKIPVRP